MVAVNSQMLALESQAPSFALPDTTNELSMVKTSDFAGQALLVMFICNHCPYVLRLMPGLAELGNWAQQQGLGVVAISANDQSAYPQDAPNMMTSFAERMGFEFPYLFDDSQDVAKVYQAACTPDFYVFDADHRLRYRGQMDSARPGNDLPADGSDVRAAITAIVNGEQVNQDQIASIGCNIKWKPGNQPDYF